MIQAPSMTPQEVGLFTLEQLSTAGRLNQWMFDSIKPYVQGEILEIGSGIGNISAYFVDSRISLYVSDYSDQYCKILRKKFAREPLVQDVLQVDLAAPQFESLYPELLGKFNTVFALNVVEHIFDDHHAITNCYKLLSPAGRLIILVPAYRFLYNCLDKELEHYRRYTRTSLKQLLQSQGFEIMRCWHLNMAGILGWFWSGTVFKRKTLPFGQLKFYNRLVPLFRIADKMVLNQVGLSVVGVGRKKLI